MYELQYYDDAIINFQKSIELDPNMYQAYQFLGILYMQLEKYELAT